MFGPVPSMALVKRELLSTLRKVRVFWILLTFVGVLSLMLFSQWPQKTQFANMAYTMRSMLMALSVTYILMAAALCIPPLAAPSIVGEKEQETFDLLSLTLIRPSGILFGKMCNTLGFFLLIFVACMPIFGSVFFAVGVDWTQVARAFAIVLASAVSCSLISIACSAWVRKTAQAVVLSYLTIVMVMGGGVLIGAFLVGAIFSVNAMGNMIQRWIEVVCPVAVLASVFGMGGRSTVFQEGLLYQCLVAIVAWVLARHALARGPRTLVVANTKVIDDVKMLTHRRRSFPFYLVDPLRRKKSIEDGRNPMMVRELRWGAMSRSSAMIRIFYIAFLLYLFLGMGATFLTHSFDSMAFWLGTQIVVTLAGAPLLTANSFTKEYELGNINMLRMTLLRPHEIILGKVYAGGFALSPLILAAFLSAVPCIPFALGEWPLLVSGYITLLSCSLLSLSLGFFASVIAKRSSVSIALSYIFGIVAYLGSALAAMFFGVLMTSAGVSLPSERDVMPVICFCSPVLALFYGWDKFNLNNWEAHGDPGFIGYWGCNVVLTVVFSLFLIRLSIAILERRMRDE